MAFILNCKQNELNLVWTNQEDQDRDRDQQEIQNLDEIEGLDLLPYEFEQDEPEFTDGIFITYICNTYADNWETIRQIPTLYFIDIIAWKFKDFTIDQLVNK